MIVVTAREMKQLDSRTIEEYDVPAEWLMENAGRRVVEEIENTWGPVKGKRIAIVCGKGNNGGDGLVAARHLLKRSARTRVYLMGPTAAVMGEARTNLERFREIGGTIQALDEESAGRLAGELSEQDIVIDALFGTGLSSPLTGLAAQAVEAINASGKPVLSVDLPSGIHTDTGQIMGTAVKADVTVTLALPKRGLLLWPGAEQAGRLEIRDIGIPEALVSQISPTVRWLSAPEHSAILKRRPMNAHKGSFGHVLVIAGSIGKGGAAVMTSLSALRIGGGLVTLAVPSSLEGALPDRPLEIMTLPLPQTEDRTLAPSGLDSLLKFAEDKTVAAIGPGLSTQPETARLVHDLITNLSIPMVIDADGLNILASHLDILKQARAPIVLTPHPGEMARLAGTSSEAVQADRLAAASEFVGRYPVTLVLKGARTVIADRDGILTINTTGNPGMATAGTGDVLTGIIAGLIAQGYTPDQAACLGVYLHGLAGDLAADEIGEIGFLAGDLIRQIPAALSKALG